MTLKNYLKNNSNQIYLKPLLILLGIFEHVYCVYR